MKHITASSCLATLALLAATASAQSSGPLNGVHYVVGHRGAAFHAPENTCQSFDIAMELGADYMECDVVKTLDDVVICLHDDTVDRTSNCSGTIQEMTLAEARECDYGSWWNEANPDKAQARFAGAPVPTFGEHLDCAFSANPDMRLLIEIKQTDALTVELMMEELEKRGLLDDSSQNPAVDKITVQSFSHSALQVARRVNPNVATGQLLPTLDFPPVAYNPLVVDMQVPPCAAAVPAFIEAQHALGQMIFCFTENDEGSVNTLLDMGVDGIITDRPDMVRRVLDERGVGTSQAERGTPMPEITRVCPDLEADPTAPFTAYEDGALVESGAQEGQTEGPATPSRVAPGGRASYAASAGSAQAGEQGTGAAALSQAQQVGLAAGAGVAVLGAGVAIGVALQKRAQKGQRGFGDNTHMHNLA